MCLAVPARVIELLDGKFAVVEQGGVRTTISLALIADVSVGDYVVAHVGFAVTKLESMEAEGVLALLTELSENAPRH